MALGPQAMAVAGSMEWQAAMAVAGSMDWQAAEAALARSGPAGEGKEEVVVHPVDPALFWGDEERVKRELVAWAKAVASMAVHRVGFDLQRCDYQRRRAT